MDTRLISGIAPDIGPVEDYDYGCCLFQPENRCFAREGVIIKCPQNDLFHDRRDIIIMSQMALSQISLTVAVNENVGTLLLLTCLNKRSSSIARTVTERQCMRNYLFIFNAYLNANS